MNEFQVRKVTPGPTPNTTGINNVNPIKTDLTLNQWYEVPFTLTDQELQDVADGVEVRALDQAVEALVAYVDLQIIIAAQQAFFNFTGTAGITPFGASDVEVRTARRILSQAKAPMINPKNLSIVLDPLAMANAVGLDIFKRVDASGSNAVLQSGTLNTMTGFGVTWFESQNVPTHATSAAGVYAVDATATAGDAEILIDDGAGALPTALVVGDKFTIAGSAQQYTVTGYVPGATEAAAGISPNLDQDVADGSALTVVSTDYTANLAFHRESIAFASRPNSTSFAGGNMVQEINDPLSQLSLMLEVSRQHKQVEWSVSILYGIAVPRPEWGAVILG
jgi:hypothetical protein